MTVDNLIGGQSLGSDARRAPLVLAILGAVAGLLTGLIPFSPASIPTSINHFYIHETPAPLQAPFLFAAVLVYGLWRWKGLGAGGALIVIVFTVVAWLLAINATLNIGDWLSKLQTPTPTTAPVWVFVVAGGVGGLIGSAVTMAGVAFAVPGLRRIPTLLPAVIAGTMVGFLLFNELVVLDTAIKSTRFIVLFVVWQAAVAAMLGRAIARDA